MDSWNRRHAPLWRSVDRRKHAKGLRIWWASRQWQVSPSLSAPEQLYWAVHAASALAAFFALIPGRMALGLPISFGLRDGDGQSWAIMGFIMLSLALVAGVEVVEKRWFSAVAILAVVACLFVVCTTDPLSQTHLNAFSSAIFIEAAWFFFAGVFAENTLLASLALVCLAGAITAMVFVGIGERFLILTGLFGINLAVRVPRQAGWA